MGKYSYGMFALNDLAYLWDFVKPLNSTCTMCHEVVEKLLKHVIDVEFEPTTDVKDLLHSHNLYGLVRKIGERYTVKYADFPGIEFLHNFYFNGHYPTDNCMIVNADEVNVCVDCVNSVVAWFFTCVSLTTVFHLYQAVTGVSDDIGRFPDNKDTRRLLADLCDVHAVKHLTGTNKI